MLMDIPDLGLTAVNKGLERFQCLPQPIGRAVLAPEKVKITCFKIARGNELN